MQGKYKVKKIKKYEQGVKKLPDFSKLKLTDQTGAPYAPIEKDDKLGDHIKTKMDYLDVPQRAAMWTYGNVMHNNFGGVKPKFETPSEHMKSVGTLSNSSTAGKITGLAADVVLDPTNLLPLAAMKKLGNIGKFEKVSQQGVNAVNKSNKARNIYNGGVKTAEAVDNLSDTYDTAKPSIKKLANVVSKQSKGNSGIRIKPENKGKFTAKAVAKGEGVQEYAQEVLSNKESNSPATVKQANFAKNATKFKHATGSKSVKVKKYAFGVGSLNSSSKDDFTNGVLGSQIGTGTPTEDDSQGISANGLLKGGAAGEAYGLAGGLGAMGIEGLTKSKYDGRYTSQLKDENQAIGRGIGAGVGQAANLLVPGLGSLASPLLSSVGGAIQRGLQGNKLEGIKKNAEYKDALTKANENVQTDLTSFQAKQYGTGTTGVKVAKKSVALNLPTKQDSTDLYNNALALDNNYKSKNYTQGMSRNTNAENVFESLDMAKQKVDDRANAGRTTTVVKDGKKNERVLSPEEYRTDVDKNKFYQRESESNIIDSDAPMGLYDKRIKPQRASHYKNNMHKELNGDEVTSYSYDPIAVQPWQSMNPVQKAERVKKYGIPEGVNYNPLDNSSMNKVATKSTSIIADTTKPKTNAVVKPIPMITPTAKADTTITKIVPEKVTRRNTDPFQRNNLNEVMTDRGHFVQKRKAVKALNDSTNIPKKSKGGTANTKVIEIEGKGTPEIHTDKNFNLKNLGTIPHSKGGNKVVAEEGDVVFPTQNSPKKYNEIIDAVMSKDKYKLKKEQAKLPEDNKPKYANGVTKINTTEIPELVSNKGLGKTTVRYKGKNYKGLGNKIDQKKNYKNPYVSQTWKDAVAGNLPIQNDASYPTPYVRGNGGKGAAVAFNESQLAPQPEAKVEPTLSQAQIDGRAAEDAYKFPTKTETPVATSPQKSGNFDNKYNPLELASTAYNLGTGLFGKAEKVNRKDYNPQLENYVDTSSNLRRETNAGYKGNLSNARNLSAGNANNFRANAQAAANDKFSKVNQIDSQEYGKQVDVNNRNVDRINDGKKINVDLFNNYEDQDARNRAVKSDALSRGMEGLSDIGSRSNDNRNALQTHLIDQQTIREGYQNYGKNSSTAGTQVTGQDTSFNDGTGTTLTPYSTYSQNKKNSSNSRLGVQFGTPGKKAKGAKSIEVRKYKIKK